MNEGDKPGGPRKAMETTSSRSKKQSAKLSRDVQAKLGQQLRAMYDDVLSQGVPDRFADLLTRLDGNANKDKH
jgi:hypothetical protein